MHQFTIPNPSAIAALVPTNADTVTLEYHPKSRETPFSVVTFGSDYMPVVEASPRPYSTALQRAPLLAALAQADSAVEVHDAPNGITLVCGQTRTDVPAHAAVDTSDDAFMNVTVADLLRMSAASMPDGRPAAGHHEDKFGIIIGQTLVLVGYKEVIDAILAANP